MDSLPEPFSRSPFCFDAGPASEPGLCRIWCCSLTSSDTRLDAGISVSEAAVTALSAVAVI